MDLEVGYMEFSRPTIEEAVEKLKARGYEKIVFVNTPGLMMRSSHSLYDVPGILRGIAAKYADTRLFYARPGIDFGLMSDVFVKRINHVLGRQYPSVHHEPQQATEGFGVVLIAHGDIPLEHLQSGKNMMGNAEEHIEAWSEMVRGWPRTESNDPLYFDTLRLEKLIREKGGYDNIEVGNLEFSSPSLLECVDKVMNRGAKKICFIGGTGFMDRSSHTLIDIPGAVEKLRRMRPGVEMSYIYPDIGLICEDLAQMIVKKANEAMISGEVRIS
jgi:sirohydrochlorin ferrochelatase